MDGATSAQVAQAVAAAAVQAGQDTPTVRGADWQTATVTAVNADGTVSCGTAIRARRLESYQLPVVGDQIMLTRSGTGSWIAVGRTATTTPAWTPLSLASGWTANANYYTPACRVWPDGTAGLCGLSSMSGTLTSGTTVATLPAVARPAAQVRAPVQVAIGFFGVMTLFPSGDIQLADFNPTLSTTGTKYAQFDVLGRYRLA